MHGVIAAGRLDNASPSQSVCLMLTLARYASPQFGREMQIFHRRLYKNLKYVLYLYFNQSNILIVCMIVFQPHLQQHGRDADTTAAAVLP